MLWIHPAIQFLCTLLGFYVLLLGWPRFSALHLDGHELFQWNRHVRLGTVALIVWTLGLFTGIAAAYSNWNLYGITGAHYWVGLLMLPLAIFGYISGLYMHLKKARRSALPLAHGICNTALCMMALYQIWSGWLVLRGFVIA